MAKDKVNEQEEFNGIDTVLTVDTTIDISELPLISLEGEVSSNQASQVAGITPLSSQVVDRFLLLLWKNYRLYL